MSANKNDGGPAFPNKTVSWDFGEDGVGDKETERHGGMSLRDYFAGQALIGVAAYAGESHRDPDIYAKAAYGLADAMLAERSKP